MRDARATPLLAARDVQKSYGATHVLRGVDFTLRAGEIHALLGGNGAGKSTLIRILTGKIPRDAGEITTASHRRPGTDPVIAVVHQELALLPNLTVAENIGIVHGRRVFGLHSPARQAQIAFDALRVLDADLATRALHLPASGLSLHEAQIVEIARALSIGAEVLLLDEPTANLTAQETALFFGVLRKLVADQGIAIVFVSHRMKEIRQLCDRCTILRDGRSVVEDRSLSDLSDAEIVAQMGQSDRREPVAATRAQMSDQRDVVLAGPDGAEIALAAGTILGLAGAPTGPMALITALTGGARHPQWRITAEGMPSSFSSPGTAVKHGIGYISGDRAGKGVLADLPILDNVMAARRIRQGRHVIHAKELVDCAALVGSLKLKAASLHDLPRTLSGGNQQKLLVARWLGLPLRVLVLEEPTRGVDIGTKRDIYGLIRQMAATGAIVIWWSTENAELLELCDRIFAFDTQGRPAGDLSADRFTEEGIAERTGMAA
ncbi:sugar ABC transporter ATP-binding protein [Paragemmobacter ruber]|uniref:ATP-binding cassette domain-containing protein n=1 Tax=Paragemmobacter ruber TaxID=1985673 RepID=A0ABW9Y541_9RHOB|nr:sugar ABC transporter ATP-binding protein [Rhodobacter ruber]NBE06935.1 ATP-binding cassette domain-containing protein [Rhodobacter ruber]